MKALKVLHPTWKKGIVDIQPLGKLILFYHRKRHSKTTGSETSGGPEEGELVSSKKKSRRTREAKETKSENSEPREEGQRTPTPWSRSDRMVRFVAWGTNVTVTCKSSLYKMLLVQGIKTGSCSSDFPSLHDNLHVLFSAQTTVHHAFHQWRVSKSIFSIYSFDSPNDIVNWKPSRQSKDFKSFPGRRHDAQTSRFLHNVSFLIPNGCHFYLESKRVSLLENILGDILAILM